MESEVKYNESESQAIESIWLSRKVALCSLGIGAFFIISYALLKFEIIAAFGVAYIVATFVVNFVILIKLSCQLLIFRKLKNEIFFTIILVIINIPVTYIYLRIAVKIFFRDVFHEGP